MTGKYEYLKVLLSSADNCSSEIADTIKQSNDNFTLIRLTRAVLSQGGPRDAAVNFDKKFTTASRGFCATARLSCIVLHQRPFK